MKLKQLLDINAHKKENEILLYRKGSLFFQLFNESAYAFIKACPEGYNFKINVNSLKDYGPYLYIGFLQKDIVKYAHIIHATIKDINNLQGENEKIVTLLLKDDIEYNNYLQWKNETIELTHKKRKYNQVTIESLWLKLHQIEKLLHLIDEIQIDETTPMEALGYLSDIKNKVNQIKSN